VTKWFSDNRQTLIRALGSVLALVLLLILIQEQGDGKLFSALRRVSIGYFLAAVVHYPSHACSLRCAGIYC
jgi:hypothetical protein